MEIFCARSGLIRHSNGSLPYAYYFGSWYSDDLINLRKIFHNKTQKLIEGKQSTYFKNHKLESSQTYVNNKLSGLRMVYHPNGNKRFHFNYTNGILNGNYSCWDENGSLTTRGNYNNGRKDSTIYYFESYSYFKSDYFINKFMEDEKLTKEQVKNYLNQPSVKLIIVNNKEYYTKTRVDYYLNGRIKEITERENGESITKKYDYKGNLIKE